jgi:methylated-DNA-[protein]-cysteine S-methyltransferase
MTHAPVDGFRLLLLSSPVGLLLVGYAPAGVREVRLWPQGVHPPAGTRDAPAVGDALGRAVRAQLAEYFAGARRDFDLPLDPAGTSFQRRVWEELRRIPYGQVRSYAELAGAVGVRSARAAGQANARNPLPVLIPCHRVVQTGGGIGGYALGVERKRWLLRHEGALRELL